MYFRASRIVRNWKSSSRSSYLMERITLQNSVSQRAKVVNIASWNRLTARFGQIKHTTLNKKKGWAFSLLAKNPFKHRCLSLQCLGRISGSCSCLHLPANGVSIVESNDWIPSPGWRYGWSTWFPALLLPQTRLFCNLLAIATSEPIDWISHSFSLFLLPSNSLPSSQK